jgi:hypothetical protein
MSHLAPNYSVILGDLRCLNYLKESGLNRFKIWFVRYSFIGGKTIHISV